MRKYTKIVSINFFTELLLVENMSHDAIYIYIYIDIYTAQIYNRKIKKSHYLVNGARWSETDENFAPPGGIPPSLGKLIRSCPKNFGAIRSCDPLFLEKLYLGNG